MPLYVSSGIRDFGARPVAPYRRNAWEFYVALRGRLAPVYPPERAGSKLPTPRELAQNMLWVFPPTSMHGWRGEPRRPASVAVFHFDEIPRELAAHVAKAGPVRVRITPSESKLIARLAHELQPLLYSEDLLLGLHGDRARLELTILVMRKLMALPDKPDHSDEVRVLAAERWFGAHLELGPTIMAIACQIGVSPAHLRRMFVAVRGKAPKAVLERIRLARAESLLAAGDLKLDAVAAASGYASASVFVQAFRKARGVTPDVWRRTCAVVVR